MSVEELKQVVEKWKNEDGTERAVLLHRYGYERR